MNQGPLLLAASSVSVPFISASAGRAEGTERCAPATLPTDRLPGSLSAPPEDASSSLARRPLPGPWLRRAGRRELALPLPGLHPSLPGHLPLSAPTCRSPPQSWAGAGNPPSSLRSSHLHHPPLKGCWLSSLTAGSKVLECGGGNRLGQGHRSDPTAPGHREQQSFLLVRYGYLLDL